MNRHLAVGLLALLAFGCAQRPPDPGPTVEPQGPEALAPEAVALPPPEYGSSVMEYGSSAMIEPLKPPALSATTCLSYQPATETRISTVRSVIACAKVVGAEGRRTLAVEFIAPGGFPYERREKELKGSAFETQLIEFDLPVAGTMIDTSRMSGKWSARFFLDGQPLATRTFDLLP